MIALEEACARFPGLALEDAVLWIERRWLRAEPAPGGGGGWLLTELDVARIGLLVELRVTLEVTDELMPVVLSLMDQLYDARRTVRRLLAALDEQPAELRGAVLAAAARHARDAAG